MICKSSANIEKNLFDGGCFTLEDFYTGFSALSCACFPPESVFPGQGLVCVTVVSELSQKRINSDCKDMRYSGNTLGKRHTQEPPKPLLG